MQIEKGTSAKCFMSSATAKSCFQNKTLSSFLMLRIILGREANG